MVIRVCLYLFVLQCYDTLFDRHINMYSCICVGCNENVVGFELFVLCSLCGKNGGRVSANCWKIEFRIRLIYRNASFPIKKDNTYGN